MIKAAPLAHGSAAHLTRLPHIEPDLLFRQLVLPSQKQLPSLNCLSFAAYAL